MSKEQQLFECLITYPDPRDIYPAIKNESVEGVVNFLCEEMREIGKEIEPYQINNQKFVRLVEDYFEKPEAKTCSQCSGEGYVKTRFGKKRDYEPCSGCYGEGEVVIGKKSVKGILKWCEENKEGFL